MSDFLAGFAEVDFTPAPGQVLRGQQRRRVAERTRDPLLADAMALSAGGETVVLVSADILFVRTEDVSRAQERFEKRTGIDGRRLLVHTTHSHVSPATFDYHWGKADPAFVERFLDNVVEAAAMALDRLEPATPYSGAGSLECLGWNRRTMFADGSTTMHGRTDRPDFIGMEGPRDGTLSIFATRNAEGRVQGVVVNFANHPNSVENEEFYSADIPGEVRRFVKLWLGADAGVVYLTGTAGDVAPLIRYPHATEQPWMGEDGLARSGMYIAGEAARLIAECVEPIEPADLRVERTVLAIPVRPFPKKGERCYPEFWTDESKAYYEGQEAGWKKWVREHSPAEVRVNVIRIGDTAICTNPAELFVEFGLKIRQASPARVTIISELTDGHAGYMPTALSFTRGGYETWPCSTSFLVPEAGDRVVEATHELLGRAFAQAEPVGP